MFTYHLEASEKAFVYVGPAVLARICEGVLRRFKGRIVRHGSPGTYRFCVNRRSSGGRPPHWPFEDEWTDAFDLADVEWVGRKPDGV